MTTTRFPDSGYRQQISADSQTAGRSRSPSPEWEARAADRHSPPLAIVPRSREKGVRMGNHQYFSETSDEASPTEHPVLTEFLSFLNGSILVFPGLAVLINRWLPDGYVMECFLIYFSAYAVANLLLQEIRGYEEDEFH
jgi:hypothetical protein